MRVTWKRAGRFPDIPFFAVALTATWAALAAAATILVRVRDLPPVTLCWWKNLSGIPCPTCGGTRAVLAIIDGRPFEAIRYNPLLVAALCTAAAWFLIRLVSGRSLSIELARARRGILWILVAGLCAANWAYLIARGL